MNADDKDMEITLPILQSIEQQSNITQRTLSKRTLSKKLDLVLDVTNAYLKHCINKGLIKIEQIPANRYLYYLTPKGFAEKTRLTAQYLSQSFYFFIVKPVKHVFNYSIKLCCAVFLIWL